MLSKYYASFFAETGLGRQNNSLYMQINLHFQKAKQYEVGPHNKLKAGEHEYRVLYIIISSLTLLNCFKNLNGKLLQLDKMLGQAAKFQHHFTFRK